MEASDSGEPEVAETRTTKLVNENVILRRELVRLLPAEEETDAHRFHIPVHHLQGV